MIKIRHLLDSQSERIIWLMEELGLPYNLKSYPREPTIMAPLISAGCTRCDRAPVIEDGDVVLAESLAIMTYIFELYGADKLRIAAGEVGYPDYVYWFHYSVGGLMPRAMQHMALARLPASAEDARAAAFQERFAWHLGMTDARVAANRWLAGDTFTAADVAVRGGRSLRLSGHSSVAGPYQRASGLPESHAFGGP